MTKKLYIKTYGCQMNVYDTTRMEDVLAPLGYAATETPDDADLVILNTCHIREKAAEKINDHYFPVSQNIKIHDNVLEMGAAFPEPAYEHHIGKILVAIEQQLNAQDTSRKNKRIPLIMYDGISTNVLNKETKINPDAICVQQQGDNVFVNADFLNIANPAQWKPTTDISAYTCK